VVPGEADQERIKRAVAGDQPAAESLLLTHSPRVLRSISPRIPADLRALISAEDILQEALIYAFQNIGSFEAQGPGSFHSWLVKIADHRLQDAIKRQRALKRGGGRSPLKPQKAHDSSSVIDLLDHVAANSRTPSRSGARHEAVLAVQVALAGLREDYRDAIRMRYIDGRSVEDVANEMKRSKASVQMLCHRGLKELREALGRASKFLSRTS
jgi:RNA polymerase sigma-70 factor (ECF subfamily)